MRTRLTSLLGIKHPLVLPGMSWISTPELVAAVSNAGGLGVLATGPLNAEQVLFPAWICTDLYLLAQIPPDEAFSSTIDPVYVFFNWPQTRASIRRIRELTSKPFGIGATLLMPGAKEVLSFIKACILPMFVCLQQSISVNLHVCALLSCMTATERRGCTRGAGACD
jgi:enoyl-[acyl-carrier protein] reductase II